MSYTKEWNKGNYERIKEEEEEVIRRGKEKHGPLFMSSIETSITINIAIPP